MAFAKKNHDKQLSNVKIDDVMIFTCILSHLIHVIQEMSVIKVQHLLFHVEGK